MRLLNRNDYEKLAKQAVSQFVDGGVPLRDSLVKLSDDMGLNPDQIQALVQVANTLAHLDLFDRKTDGDKIIDFAPADPKDVLQGVYSETPITNQEAPDAEDFFGASPEKKDVGIPVPPVSTAEEMPATPQQQQIMIIKIRKVAKELGYRKTAAALSYEETLCKLASNFASLYGPKYEEFEKDAMDVYGDAAIPTLSDLRNLLRLPTIKTAGFEKTARLVDTDTPEMESFRALQACQEDHTACAAGLELLSVKIGRLL